MLAIFLQCIYLGNLSVLYLCCWGIKQEPLWLGRNSDRSLLCDVFFPSLPLKLTKFTLIFKRRNTNISMEANETAETVDSFKTWCDGMGNWGQANFQTCSLHRFVNKRSFAILTVSRVFSNQYNNVIFKFFCLMTGKKLFIILALQLSFLPSRHHARL